MVGRALITGHAGFVGRHFVDRLLRAGWDVEGVDIDVGPWQPTMPATCGDVREVFAEDGTCYDLVIHCAAVVGGRAKIDGAPMAVADNLSIDAALWQWALRTRPGRVVYFSSSAAYPTDLQDGTHPSLHGSSVDLHENHIDYARIRTPDATYGLAKLVGEIQADLVRREGVPVTVIRPFSGYGDDQSTDYPLPAFIDRAIRRADPFEVWGDGGQVRDWVHIDDIVELVMRCVADGVDGPLNACTGRATSFLELASLVTGVAGYAPAVVTLPDRPSGVRFRVGDPTLMREVWSPRVSLEEGVERALQTTKGASR